MLIFLGQNSEAPMCFAWLVLYLVTQSCPTLCNPMDRAWWAAVHGDSPGKNIKVGCHALLQGIFSTQGLNPGLPHCRQILYHLSHQGSPRILEWVAYPFSRGSSRSKNQTGSPALQADSLPAEFTKKKRLFWHHLKIRSFYRKLHVSGDFLEKSVGR